jgi:hypothetical protein
MVATEANLTGPERRSFNAKGAVRGTESRFAECQHGGEGEARTVMGDRSLRFRESSMLTRIARRLTEIDSSRLHGYDGILRGCSPQDKVSVLSRWAKP